MQGARFAFMSLTVLVALAAPAAAEDVDVPEYKYWSGWREGATAKLKTQSDAATANMSITVTATLKKVTRDMLILEAATVTEFAGQKVESPAVPTEVSAKAPKDDAKKAKETKGRETLTVNGKKLDCEWTLLESEGEVKKTWISKDVPGGVVKETIRTDGSSTTSLLLQWKGEKR